MERLFVAADVLLDLLQCLRAGGQDLEDAGLEESEERDRIEKALRDLQECNLLLNVCKRDGVHWCAPRFARQMGVRVRGSPGSRPASAAERRMQRLSAVISTKSSKWWSSG